MTFRLCLVGNSHVAAFSTGWKAILDRHPSVALTFYAARGAMLGELVVRRGALRARTEKLRQTLEWVSGGSDAIVPGDYDEIWLVGLRFGIEAIIAPYTQHWAETHSPDAARTPISDALFVELAAAQLRASVALDLHDRLAGLADTPIRVVPQPNPSLIALDGDDARMAPFRLAAERGDETAIWAQYRTALDRVVAESKLVLHEQPAETRAREIFSDPKFSRGAIRLKPGLEREHAADDSVHMNADFGALMLERCLPTT